MTTKVQVTMTIEQARLIMKAMDLYSRLLMGQFGELKYLFCGFGEDAKTYNRDSEHWHFDFDTIQRLLKNVIYPDLPHNAYWGITGYSEQNKCPKEATIVYDAYKAMDYAISWHVDPEGGMTVNFDKPMHFYTELPLPEVKVFDEE